MHWWYMPLTVTTAAGTLATAPQVNTWTLRDGQLRAFHIEIPPGHNGRTGIKIYYQGTQVVPWDAAVWLVGSGRTILVPWEDDIMARGWKVQTYNVDSAAHTFWLYAEVLPDIASPAQASPAQFLAQPAQSAHHARVKKLRVLPGFRE